MNDTKPASGDGGKLVEWLRRIHDAGTRLGKHLGEGQPHMDMVAAITGASALALEHLATPEQPKCPECDKWLTGYCNSCAANVAEQGDTDGADRARKLYEPDDYEDAFKGRSQPEYFPDGSDSPIRDEARGVDGMVLTDEMNEAGEREIAFGNDFQDAWRAAHAAAPNPVRAEQVESIARRIDRVVFDPMRVADKTRKERQPEARGAEHGKCDLGVGCDEAGVCYALANGQPDRCGRTAAPKYSDEELLTAKELLASFTPSYRAALFAASAEQPEGKGMKVGDTIMVPAYVAYPGSRVSDLLIGGRDGPFVQVPNSMLAAATAAPAKEPYCPRCDNNREVLANEADESDDTLTACPDCRPAATGVQVDEDAMRTEFELAFSTGHIVTDGRNFQLYNGYYVQERIQALWEGWQKHAALAGKDGGEEE